MSLEPLDCSHARHRRSNILQALFTEVLHSHVLLEGIEGHPRVHLGVAVGRKRVICTTGVVAHSDWSPGAQENAASIDNISDPILGISGIDNEMFRCIPARQDSKSSGKAVSRQLIFYQVFSLAL